MISVDIVEAKKRFSSLLEQVKNGESIAITKDGRVVAYLKPPQLQTDRRSPEDLVKGFLELRKARHIDRAELLEWIRDGRKY